MTTSSSAPQARASTRVSIAWDGADPYEDTDTVVLTFPGHSLDLRVFKDSGGQTIDWSTVAFVQTVQGSDPENPTLRWDHILDSRPPSELPDEGTFTTLLNGDVEERGIMYNPKTAKNEAYIETWRRLALGPKAEVLLLESVDGEKAFLGRVDKWALGLSKMSDRFMAWRDEVVDGQWSRLTAIGLEGREELLPDLPFGITHREQWSKGSVVEVGARKWTVLENFVRA